MRLKVIGCDVLARPIYLYAAQSPHTVDLELFRYGLHQHPGQLRARLQAAIQASDNQGYDALLLAYGLCGKSTHGLKAGATQLVMPRSHDCITIFLGSRARYNQEFAQCPGTYWYVQDYLERSDGSGASLSIGANTGAEAENTYQIYVDKYGKDNADYLMEMMGAWQSHYSRAALIDLGVGSADHAANVARDDAKRRGWTFEHMQGDMGLVRRLVYGEWDQDFLVVPPGNTVAMTASEDILTAVPPA